MSRAEYVASWRVALRLARRRLRHRPGYATAMVAVLAVPALIAGFLWSADAAVYDNPAEFNRPIFGATDFGYYDTDAATVRDLVPPGSRLIELDTDGRSYLEGPGGLTTVEFSAEDLADPLLAGRFLLRDGRAPETTDDVTVSSALAEELGVWTGDTVEAGTPPRPLTITGVADRAERLGSRHLVVAAGNPLSTDCIHRVLVDVPTGHPVIQPSLAGMGLIEPHRSDPGAEATHAAAVLMVVGFGVVQVILLVGAVFAVSAQRSRRDLARLSAIGATGPAARRLLTAQGLLLGAGGGLLGSTIAVAMFYALRGVLERAANHVLAPEHPLPPAIGAGFGLTVLLSGLAAHLPARGVTKQSVAAGLSDRERHARRAGHRIFWAGIPTLLLGIVAIGYGVNPEVSDLLVAIGGAGLVLVGIVCLGPLLIGLLAGAASRFGLSVRLAARHAARRRLRTGAAIAAICAATAGTVGISVYLTAEPVAPAPAANPGYPLKTVAVESGDSGWITPELGVAIADELPDGVAHRFAPVAEVSALSRPDCVMADGFPCDFPQNVAVGGAELIELVTGEPAPPEALTTLANGGAVSFYSAFDDAGTIVLFGPEDRLTRLPVTTLATDPQYRRLPGAVVSQATADANGWRTTDPQLVVSTSHDPDDTEYAAAEDVLLRAQLAAGDAAPVAPARLTVAKPLHTAPGDAMAYILGIAGALVTLVAAAVTVGLALQELHGGFVTLSAVGAPDRVRRRIAAGYALLVVGLGALLGTVAGFGPAAGLAVARPDLAWSPPWPLLAALVIGLPVLAALGAFGVAGRRLPSLRPAD